MAKYQTIARTKAKTDTIYVCADGSIGVTPDCVGFYWYDSIAEAQEQHGDDLPIVRIGGVFED